MKLHDDELMHRYDRNSTDSKLSVYTQPEIVMNHLTDKEGLDKAYAGEDKLYIHGNNVCGGHLVLARRLG